jgi:hypothetical protein
MALFIIASCRHGLKCKKTRGTKENTPTPSENPHILCFLLMRKSRIHFSLRILFLLYTNLWKYEMKWKLDNILVTQDQNSKIIFVNQSRLHLKLKCYRYSKHSYYQNKIQIANCQAEFWIIKCFKRTIRKCMAQFKIINDLTHDRNGITTRVDLTGVSLFVGLGTKTFTVGQATLEVASS